MKSVSYNLRLHDSKSLRNFNYEEHLLKPELKDKFNFKIHYLSKDLYKKESYTILMKDRAKPHDWLEFHNTPDGVYLAVYYFLGAYIPRLSNHHKNEKILKLIRSLDWQPKYKENYLRTHIVKNLFSITEIVKIISDISRINYLNTFQ